MERQKIEEKARAIIVDRLEVAEEKVVPEADLTKDIGADSLERVELIMEFENEFEIAIPDDEAEKLNTFKELCDYIEKKLK